MTAPFYADERVTVHHGDCLDVLRTLPDASVASVVTDPPSGIAFMGKDWDTDKGGRDAWVAWLASVLTECRRILKPGGHALVWALPRTSGWTHRAIEDAGLTVRDCLTHIFGSGFPKSHNLPGGLGTALKPASEHWYLARKPLAGTVAGNVLAHGTGALNIDATRVMANDGASFTRPATHCGEHEGWDRPWKSTEEGVARRQSAKDAAATKAATLGRWPANVVLTHGDCGDECGPGCPVADLDAQSGVLHSHAGTYREDKAAGSNGWGMRGREGRSVSQGDSGGASRFFPAFRYQAKAPTRERPKVDGVAHPTVKPLALMAWLVRLVTPPGGVVLDPFAGSGTTVEAALAEGFRCITIEREAEYLPLILARIERQAAPAPSDGPEQMSLLDDEPAA